MEVIKSAGQIVPADVAELAGRHVENSKARKLEALRAKKKAMRQEKANKR